MSDPAEPLGVDHLGMALALAEASRAVEHGDVPVGCAILSQSGTVLALGHNERERAGDPTAHAEIVALRKASAVLGHWRLLGATVYVTLEPCAMCAGALVNARVERVVWGADDEKAGGMRSKYTIGTDGRLNHTIRCDSGVLAKESAALLRGFFRARRRR